MHVVVPEPDLDRLTAALTDHSPAACCHGWAMQGTSDFAVTEPFIDLMNTIKALGAKALGSDKEGTFILVCIPASRQMNYGYLPGLLQTAMLDIGPVSCRAVYGPDSQESEQWISIIEQEYAHLQGNLQVRYEGADCRKIQEFVEVDLDKGMDASTLSIKEGGVYWIPGGLGGVERVITKELATYPGIQLIISGRSELNDEARSWLEGLKPCSNRPDYMQVDLADRSSVERGLAEIKKRHQRVDGIFHCAGVFKPGMIFAKQKEDIEATFKPKVVGTVNLDEATRDEKLEFMVYFSSLAAVFGHQGQWDYAAANAFQDGYADYRNRLVAKKERHGLTITINWPSWEEGGMFMDEGTKKIMFERGGMRQITNTLGVKALRQALTVGKQQFIVLTGERKRLEETLLNSMRGKDQTASLSQKNDRPKPHKPEGNDTLTVKAEQILRNLLSPHLKCAPETVDLDIEFSEMGFDLILVVTLVGTLYEEHSITIEPFVFFEYTTPRSLAGYLVEHVSPIAVSHSGVEEAVIEVQAEPLSKETVPYEAKGNEPIAVIGLAGRYPGSFDLDTFWTHLLEGKEAIREVPEDRESLGTSKRAGFMDGVNDFDPLFFSIAPRDAEWMNPKERLFLQCAWHVFEDAGYTPSSLSDQDMGVFVGVSNVGVDFYPDTFSAVSNRVSYAFNLKGPSLSLDTMCSASLVAIHEACRSIGDGECGVAIAGGVNVYLHASHFTLFAKNMMLAPDGKAKAFGKGADGMVPGEGVGAIMLKPLSRALNDHDHIYGLIRGTSINHGGKTNGYTVPNPKAQSELIRKALHSSGLDARAISYVEAHGTGTCLGDLIEIQGLDTAFKQDTADTDFCRIGSVKSNIGHLEAGAGIAGITKVLLQIKHRTLVPSLHARETNPEISFAPTPFRVQQQAEDWNPIDEQGRPMPRIASISGFGAGGTNAHAIIEEYIPRHTEPVMRNAKDSGPYLVVLSTKNEERLKEVAQNLIDYVHPSTLDFSTTADQPVAENLQPLTPRLQDVAYTLQVGREAMEERLGLIVGSLEDLKEKLEAFLNRGKDVEDLCRGQVKRNKKTLAVFTADEDMTQTIDAWIKKGKYSKLLDLWVRGFIFDWNKLYGENKPQRIRVFND